jgi:hypothetical protein
LEKTWQYAHLDVAKDIWKFLSVYQTRNPNIEIPAFAEAASRRQAKQFQTPKFETFLFGSFVFCTFVLV